MSLKAGRVGVNPREVDVNGNLKGSSSGAYTKEETDAKFETKENIGGLKFRVENDNAQYKTPNGNWVNFNSGGGGIGWNIPTDLLQPFDYISSNNFTLHEGGYCVIDDMLYVQALVSMSTTGMGYAKITGYNFVGDSDSDNKAIFQVTSSDYKAIRAYTELYYASNSGNDISIGREWNSTKPVQIVGQFKVVKKV